MNGSQEHVEDEGGEDKMDSVITTAGQKIAEQGIVFAMFIIITVILCKAVKVLYDRNQAMGDAFLNAITEHTTATNNLANKIENMK